jgi:hypothetical protein
MPEPMSPQPTTPTVEMVTRGDSLRPKLQSFNSFKSSKEGIYEAGFSSFL